MYAYEWLKDLLLGRGRTNSEQGLSRVSSSDDKMVPGAKDLLAFSGKSEIQALDLLAPFLPRDQLSRIDPNRLMPPPVNRHEMTTTNGSAQENPELSWGENQNIPDTLASLMSGPADWLGPMIHSGPFADLGDAAQPDSFTNPSFDIWYDLIAGPRNAMAELESQLYGETNPNAILLGVSASPESRGL